jgi:predicted amidohydrolase YtcJ
MPIGPLSPKSERVQSLRKLIEAATINGARGNLIDGITGSIEVGKMADIVVMDQNFFTIVDQYNKDGSLETLEALATSKPMLTLFEGRVVFTDGTF